MRFDHKISSLEKREDLATFYTLIMDEIHGIIIAYETRIE
jgi:hypothetical protein